MRIAICDDDRLWNEQASNILNQYFQERNESVEIICFESPDQLLAYQGPPVSVLFVDIEFDEQDDTNKTDRIKGADRSNNIDIEESRDNCKINIKESRDKNIDVMSGRDESRMKEADPNQPVSLHGSGQGNGTGIEFVGTINALWPGCRIVYCTNYLYYAVDVYETRHIYYVVKNQFRSRLDQIFDKVVQGQDYSKESLYFQLIGGEIVCIPIRNIMFFERRSRHTEVVTGQDRFSIKEKIGEIADKMPGDRFTRCHHSFLINMDYISVKKGNGYEMKTGEYIPISRGYARSSKEEFLRWCSDRML